MCIKQGHVPELNGVGGKPTTLILQSVVLCPLLCAESLTLWFFQSTLLIPVPAPQFYPRCIASKERKTERESERLGEKACMGDER